jgi:hypothetical protein
VDTARAPRKLFGMTTPLRRWAALGPILFALLGTGCVTEPTVSVHHAEVQGAGWGGLNVVAYLKIRNDNDFDVMIRNVRANVTIGSGHALPPIYVSPNMWLKSDRYTLIAVPIFIPWNLMPALAAETVGSPVVTYYVQGAADVTATQTFGIKYDNYTVNQSGTIPRHLMVNAARAVVPIPF